MVPRMSVMLEKLHFRVLWTPKRRGTVQMLMSGHCHPQLEGPQGTWPVKHICLRGQLHIYNIGKQQVNVSPS